MEDNPAGGEQEQPKTSEAPPRPTAIPPGEKRNRRSRRDHPESGRAEPGGKASLTPTVALGTLYGVAV